MLYSLVKLLVTLALKTFFNRINTKNTTNIPQVDPVIFVANHPNSIIDPFLIGYTCRRKLHYLAKSTLFEGHIKRKFLLLLQLIPIYRKQDNPDLMERNIETFSKCYEILAKGESFLIFPEGISVGDRTLHKIKTGAARIGFTAEKNNQFNLNVNIVPVGLSYSDTVKFRSDVYVRFGVPILLKEYQKLYEEDEFEAVQKVTDQIETALSKLTTNLKELDREEIVTAIESIYKKELLVDLGLDRKDKNADFSVTKGLINAVDWFFEHEPDRVNVIKAQLSHYLNTLNRLQLRDEFLYPSKRSITFSRRIRASLFLILGFPIWLYGIINNYIPYKSTRWYVQRFSSDKTHWAPMKMGMGLIIFLSYYTILIFVFAQLTGSTGWSVLYALTLIPSGNFSLKYLRKAQNYRQHLHFMSIFYQKRQLVYKLIEQRLQLIKLLDDAKRNYMAAVGLNPSNN